MFIFIQVFNLVFFTAFFTYGFICQIPWPYSDGFMNFEKKAWLDPSAGRTAGEKVRNHDCQ
jgi:hypothetical protein